MTSEAMAKTNKPMTICNQLWNIANTCAARWVMTRDYILGFIFCKYLSERMHLFADEILKHDGITFDAIDEKSSDTHAMPSKKNPLAGWAIF